MSIIDDTDSIGLALTRLETERLDRFKSKPLDYDVTANAGEFVWNMMQTGEALNATVWPAVAQDDRITRIDLMVDIDMFAFVRWLNNQDQVACKIWATSKISFVDVNNHDKNSGMSNVKIYLCRLRMLQLL